MFLKKIKNFIKWFIPYGIIIRKRYKFLDQKECEIENYFLSLDADEIVDYIERNGFSVYPYDFFQKYHASDVDVFLDMTTNTKYVIHENRRLYFPQDWRDENIRAYYNAMRIEQDEDSPHRYEANGYVVQEGDVIADVGSAEGIWALNNAERAGKIYLFEYDKKWIETLQKTFEPWKEKVVIVNKYVSNINDNENTTLDSFFNKKRIDFIKADIEGMEIKLLEGSKNILVNNNNLKLLLCAYHSKNDGPEIMKILEMNGFTTEYSKRYMLFIHDKKLEKPYIRRGLIRAMKSVKNDRIKEFYYIKKYFQNKTGLEIGGPSVAFMNDGYLPVYEIMKTLDGINFSSSTVWTGNIEESKGFIINGKKVGKMYIADATELSQIKNSAYDFILSSNNIEHIANPMKAMEQWILKLKPNGILTIIAPRKEVNFDHKRETVNFTHLTEDYNNAIDEHDLSHLDEILKLHDLSMDPPAGTFKQFKKRSLKNYENRCLHHHVFDLKVLEEMCRYFKLTPILMKEQKCEYIIVARK